MVEDRECQIRKDGAIVHALEPLFADGGYKKRFVGHQCPCGTVYTPGGRVSIGERDYYRSGSIPTRHVNKSHMRRMYG